MDATQRSSSHLFPSDCGRVVCSVFPYRLRPANTPRNAQDKFALFPVSNTFAAYTGCVPVVAGHRCLENPEWLEIVSMEHCGR